MTLQKKSWLSSLKLVGVIAVAVTVASCSGLKSPFNSDDVDALNSTFAFEDQDSNQGSVGGPITIDIPGNIFDKITAVKEKLTDVEVYMVKADVDFADVKLNELQPVATKKVADLTSGLNSLGTVPAGTKYYEGDKLLLAFSSATADRSGKNPVSTGVNTSILDVVGVAASASDVVVISTPKIEEKAAVEFQTKGVKLGNVLFDYDSSEVKSVFVDSLGSELATYISSGQKIRIQVSGYCDERGTQEYNLALGERRAEAVRRQLVALGFASDSVFTVSYGEENPVEAGHDEAAWSKNRRAEVVVLID